MSANDDAADALRAADKKISHLLALENPAPGTPERTRLDRLAQKELIIQAQLQEILDEQFKPGVDPSAAIAALAVESKKLTDLADDLAQLDFWIARAADVISAAAEVIILLA